MRLRSADIAPDLAEVLSQSKPLVSRDNLEFAMCV